MALRAANSLDMHNKLLSDCEQEGRPMSDEIFPKDLSGEILGELSAWTSVANVMVAARILEGRTIPGDDPDNKLLMPLAYEEPLFEQIFLILLDFLIAGYKVPSQKVEVCRVLDPQITETTGIALQSLRFRPIFQHNSFSGMQGKWLSIEDQPAVIEIIRTPLNCLMDLYLNIYKHVRLIQNIAAECEESTGGRPKFYHKPAADARLPSFIEAACLHAFGLTVGTQFAEPGRADIVCTYRAVNVQTLPPVDSAKIEFAFQASQGVLNALR